MAGPDITMLGDKGLEWMLRKLPVKVQDRIVKKAVRKSAPYIKDQVLRRIPSDTGKYRKLMGAQTWVSSTKKGIFYYGLEFPTREELGISADDEHFWPAALEYGHGKVAPRPHLRPALDEHRLAIIEIISGVLRTFIFREAKKLATKR